MLQNDIPFDRGQTYFGGNTTDSTSGEHLLGQTAEFHDKTYTGAGGVQYPRHGGGVKNLCMLVRNTSGIALLPGRVAVWKTGKRFKEVDGYVTTTAAEGAGVVDEWLPTAGVAANDIFWLMRKGVTLGRMSNSADETAVTSEGSVLCAMTAATSQATSAGRMRPVDWTTAATGVTLGNQIANAFGRAMSANTTAQTNRLLLVAVNFLE